MTSSQHQDAVARRPASPSRPRLGPDGTVGMWQRASTAWMAFSGTAATASAAVGLLVFSCVFLAVVGPRQSLALRTHALRAELSHVGSLGRSVYAFLDYSAFEATQPGDARAIADAGSRLNRNLRATGLPLSAASADWSGLTSGFNPVTGAAPRLYGTGTLPPQLELVYRTDLLDHAKLTAGRFPDVARSDDAGTVFEIAVTQATAARLGLKVGSRLGIDPRITLTVTGIVRPANPQSSFWTADPAPKAPQLDENNSNFPPYWVGGGFVGPAELGTLESVLDISKMSVSWDFPLNLTNLQASQAAAVQHNLNHAVTQSGQISTAIGSLAASGTPVTLVCGVSSVLAAFIAQDQAVGSVLSLLMVSLAGVAAAVVLLAAFLIMDHRRSELAVMRARGGSSYQVAGIVFRAGAAVAIPAAVAGAALAVGLTPGAGTSLSWWLAGSTVLVAILGPPAVTTIRHRRVRKRPDPGSARRIGAVRRLIVEASLTALAIGGLVVLRQRAQLSSDVYPELAPVLLAIPAALLVMRCYPVVLRGLVKVAGQLPGATAFVGFARAARTAPRAILPMFALVLALSAVGFGTMMRAAVARGQVAASWQRVGADALINASGLMTGVTPEAQRSVAAVPGVQHLVMAELTSGRTSRGTALTVAIVDPQRYAALIASSPLPAFPAAKLANTRSGPLDSHTVPVLATAQAAAALSAGPAQLDIGPQKITVKVTGVTTGLAWAAGPVVVLPLTALRTAAMTPNVMLVTGPYLDGRRLESVVRRVLPGAIISLRSAVLAEHVRAPLPKGAFLALAMASSAAAGLIVLTILIALVLSAPSREDTLARLAVMGLEPRQSRWLVATEVLPQVTLAAAGGLGCAALLAPLLAPAIDLSSLTGSPSSVPVSTQPVPLAIAAAGLLGVAILTVVVQTVAASRGRAARAAIRVSE